MRFAKVAAASTALLLAAACGGGGDGGSSDGGVPQELDPANAPDTLTIWTMGSARDELTTYFDELEAAYQETYPDTKVEVKFVPWGDAQEAINNAMAGGDAPDVLEVGNDQVSNWAAQGALYDVTENVEKWDAAADIDQASLEYAQFKGKQYAVPLHVAPRTLLYRADWLRDIGMEAPKTWEDLTKVAKAIEEETGKPGYGAPTDFTNGIASFIWSNGGEIAVQEDGKWAGKLTSPKTQEAIEFYAGLSGDISPNKYIGENELTPLADMANGELGMYIDGAWAIGQMKEQAGDPKLVEDVAAAPIPGADGMAPAFAGGSDLTVFKTSENPGYAFELIKLWAGKEFGKKWADTAGFYPVYPDMLDDPAYQEDPMKAAGAKQLTKTKYFPATPNWTEADFNGKIIPNAVREIAEGGDPDKVLEKANKKLTEVLNQPIE